MSLFECCLYLLLLVASAVSLQVSGQAKYEDRRGTTRTAVFHYLAKFGATEGSNLYMYGNVERIDKYYSNIYHANAILVLVPSSVWDKVNEDLENRDNKLHGAWCRDAVNNSLNSSLLSCGDNNYFITVPCDSSTCFNHSFPGVPNSQIYMRRTSASTEYWYAFLLFCGHDTSVGSSCDWQYSAPVDLDYTLYIVSGDPFDENHDPFYYQFPANQRGLLITFLTFSVLYALLVPFHLLVHGKYFVRCKVPALVWLFTFALVFENLNILCGLVHYAVYASDGIGAVGLNRLKEVLNLIGNWFLITILVLVAGGWMVTVRTIKWKFFSFLVMGVYIFFSVVYLVWSMVYPNIIDPVDIKDPLQTWAGGLYLTVRALLLFYVWYQIYHIHRQEEMRQKLRLYEVLFVLFTIWFWYLPLFVIIASVINPVYSTLVLVNSISSMNFIVNLIMTALLCPIWSREYFKFDHIMNKQRPSAVKGLLGTSYSSDLDSGLYVM